MLSDADKMGDSTGSDDDLSVLFERVSSKLGWKSDANLDELFEQLSQSTKKKKSKRPLTSGKKQKKSGTTTKKKTQDLSKKKSRSYGTPPSPSSDLGQGSVTSSAGIRNEISRNLKLEFQAGICNSDGITVAKVEEGKVLRETTPVVSLENKRGCVASASFHDDACKSDHLADVSGHSTGSEGDRLEELKHSSEAGALDNEENWQLPDEAESINERTSYGDEDVVPSYRKLHQSSKEVLNISRSPVKSAEKDILKDIPKDIPKEFADSPQPMQWLMSPPSSKPRPSKPTTPQTLSSDRSCSEPNADSNQNDDDIADILSANFPSLSERLAQNHLENKRKQTASRKNRRRSCANPRSAPFLLDKEWADDEEKNGQEKKEEDAGDDETRLEAGDDGEEERTTGGREEEADAYESFKHQDQRPKSQMKDRQSLNTSSESFQKPRSRCQDSSSDDDFESFLKAVKTPQHPKHQSGQSDPDEAVYVVDDDDFIDDGPLESRSDDDDEDVFYVKVNNLDNPLTSGKRTTKKHPTVGSRSGSILSQLLSSDDDDDDDDVFMIPKTTPSVGKPNSKVSTSTTSSKKTPAKQRRPLQPTTLPSNRCYSTPSRTEQPAPVSFLASLSTPGKGMSTRSRYVSDFKRNKDELMQKLFKLYNESVFENKLPSDFSITWNNRMRKTAGFCFYKKRLGERTARIELSVKVCDTAERLRDTLIHELCHAAAWLIHGVSDGHGKFWKYWAAKANLAHPEIPVIKRCHTYEINTKYKYKCVQCGNIIGRHSKSVDTKRFCCAYCNGRLELQPTLRKDGTPARARGPNPFAAFVKENYASVKKTHVAAKHADVMRLLSQEFASKTKITDS